jgi:hypothetical protein
MSSILWGVAAFLPVAALATYFWLRARSLGQLEADVVRAGQRWARFRTWNYRFGAVFLGVVAIAVLMAGFRGTS